MNDPISICVTGSDGSGKSTQIARLMEILNRQSISVTAVSVWDAFTDPAILEKVPLADPSAIYGYLKLLGPSSRPHFLYHALHMALELAQERRPDVLLLNGYWYKYFASEVAHGANPTVARSLTAAFPQPNWTFHLTVRPEDALRRKAHRSDYESGYADDPRMFLEFQRRTATDPGGAWSGTRLDRHRRPNAGRGHHRGDDRRAGGRRSWLWRITRNE